MNWHSRRGPLRLALAALLTTVLAVAFSAEAASAAPPNEASLWTAEMTADGLIESPNPSAEAYSGDNHLLQVWRGEDNHLYLSLDHGHDLRFGTNTEGITNTVAAPQVIPWGTNEWAVFHTGIDGRIYWMTLGRAVIDASIANGHVTPAWTALPNTTTAPDLSASVATTGSGTRSFLVAYRSSSSDNQLYSQWYDGTTFENPLAVPNGFSASSPAIIWNNALQFFVMFIRGTDRGLYGTHQELGGQWSNFFEVNNVINMNSGPSVQALSNGDMQVAARSLDGGLFYWQYYVANNSFDGPTRDSTDTTINTPPRLVGTQTNAIWTLVSYLGLVYYKLSMKENSLPPKLTASDVSANRAAFARAVASLPAG